jgi:hypothetical protein
MDDSFFMDEFIWSYSRLNSIYNCPYATKLQYIDCIKGEPSFFGQWGSFGHKLFEKYFKKELMLFDLANEYEEKYFENVTYEAPKNKYADIGENYFNAGLEYFNNFEGFDNYKIISVEEKIYFKIGEYDFITIPDLIVRNMNDKLEIIDHKSEDLEQPKRPGTKIATEFESKLRQLYLNSYAVNDKYKELPEYLNFNVFRKGRWIKIPFDIEAYNKTIQWALDTIKIIKDEKDWKPKSDFYFCNNICGYRNGICEYRG